MSNGTPALPAEIWAEIVKFSNIKSLSNIALVSKQLKSVTDADKRLPLLKKIKAEIVVAKDSVAKLKEKVKKWRAKFAHQFSSDDASRVEGKLQVVLDEVTAIEVLSKSDPDVAEAVAGKIKTLKTDLRNLQGEVAYIFDR